MLEKLLERQKKEKSELLFKHARELMDMITDDELVEIYSQYPELFAEISHGGDHRIYLLEEAIEIFTDFLTTKGISKDEYEAMTVDDVVEYLSELITRKTKSIWDLIKELENDRRNS